MEMFVAILCDSDELVETVVNIPDLIPDEVAAAYQNAMCRWVPREGFTVLYLLLLIGLAAVIVR